MCNRNDQDFGKFNQLEVYSYELSVKYESFFVFAFYVDEATLKSPRCFIEQEVIPLLLSTGWFQERIRA